MHAIQRHLLPCVLLAALSGPVLAQATSSPPAPANQTSSSQTSAVPSDPGTTKTDPMLAPNHNRGMGASSGAVSGATEAPVTSGAPAQMGAAPAPVEKANAPVRKKKATGAGQRSSQAKLKKSKSDASTRPRAN